MPEERRIPLSDAYAFPETYLEVSVQDPQIHESSGQKYVDYEVTCIVQEYRLRLSIDD